MKRHVVQAWNIRISYPDKEILLFNDDASGVFLRVKLYLQVVLAHVYSADQTLCMLIYSKFGASVSSIHLEEIARSRCKKAEPLKSSLDLANIVEKIAH